MDLFRSLLLDRAIANDRIVLPAIPQTSPTNDLAKACCKESGAVLIEAAIAISAALLILVVGIEFLRFAYINYTGNHVVKEAARWATYGDSLTGASDRVAAIKQQVQNVGKGYGIAIPTEQIQICPAADPQCAVDSSADSEKFFLIRVRHTERVVSFLDLSITMGFEALARNEPF